MYYSQQISHEFPYIHVLFTTNFPWIPIYTWTIPNKILINSEWKYPISYLNHF